MSPDVARYGEKIIAVLAYAFLAAVLMALGKFTVDALKFLQTLMETAP